MIIGPRGLADGCPQARRLTSVNILTHPLGLDPWAAAAIGRMASPPDDFVRRLDAGARIMRADGVQDRLDALWVTGSYSQSSARLNLVPWTGTVTNLVPNGEMVGAATGAPGTMPTGWASGFMVGGITRQVVGVGTLNGLRYIDVRFSGTPASASGIGIPLSPTNACPGVIGSRMTVALYLALVGGSLGGTLTRVNYTEYNASNAAVTTDYNVIPAQSIALISTLTRVSGTRVLTGATAAFVAPALEIGHGTGAIDFTLRIAAPQLVRMDVPGTYIQTSGAAASQVQTLARYDLTELNNPTWAAWASGAAPGGFVGGGTAYLDTNADPSFDFGKATLNSATYGVWYNTTAQQGTSPMGDANNRVFLLTRRASPADSASVRVHGATTITTAGGSISDGRGLLAGNRSGADAQQMYKNGAALLSSTGASTAMPVDLSLLRQAGSYNAGQVSAAFAGASLTAAQHLAIYRGTAAMLGGAPV